MLAFVLKRLLMAPFVLWIIFTLSFFLMRAAPGGPYDSERKLSAAVEQAQRERFHLDEPLPMQYLRELSLVVQGDLGTSFRYGEQSVNAILADRLPPTLILGGYALVLALLLGCSIGVYGAYRHNKWQDHLTNAGAMLGISVPVFVIAPLMVLLFQSLLGWIQPPGVSGPSFAYVSLAALCLSLPFASRIARLTRSGMLDVLHEDYLRTARAKGLDERRVILGHALRGGLMPVLGFLGPAVASILTGSLVIESIFLLKGLGQEFIIAAVNRDFTLVTGTVLVYAVLLLAANLIVDILYGLIDPRVRYD